MNISMPSLAHTAGGASALGALGSLYSAGNAVKNAVQGKPTHGSQASSFQSGLSSVFGKSTSQTAQIARHSLEAVVYASSSIALGALAVAQFDEVSSQSPVDLSSLKFESLYETVSGNAQPSSYAEKLMDSINLSGAMNSVKDVAVSSYDNFSLSGVKNATVDFFVEYPKEIAGATIGAVALKMGSPKLFAGFQALQGKVMSWVSSKGANAADSSATPAKTK